MATNALFESELLSPKSGTDGDGWHSAFKKRTSAEAGAETTEVGSPAPSQGTLAATPGGAQK
eukprot:1524142-Pyramimonas_sp.AAC.1